ncbi:STAS domain-containing protein [Streptomyces sp. TX20-6-3]|uniref:STAS domain-containing protein n=1 Tax=Streptomyces sp. TX20-6-3 TaxID=3028705 RepID=UPI0034DFE595
MEVGEFFQAHYMHWESGVLLRVTGELDIATAPLLHRAAADALTHRPRRFYLDLTKVIFCDTTGLFALRNLADHVQAAGARLYLTGLHPHLYRTISNHPHPPWTPPLPLTSPRLPHSRTTFQ